MKVSATREHLLEALQSVIGVVERRQTMPILSNVLLSARENRLRITATDLEVELVAAAEITLQQAGDITLPGRKLYDIVRTLPERTTITLTRESDKVVLRGGRSRFTLSSLPASEFPVIEQISAQHRLSLPAKDCRRLIDKTHFAMAQQDVRYYLNGTLLETDGQMLRAVATDGHRLSLCGLTLGGASGEQQQIIVPRKGVLELQRLLDGEGEITIELGSNHIRIQIGEVRLTSKLIDGKFPEYSRVIPLNPPRVMSGPREALRAALQRTAILSNEKYRGVRLTFASGLLTVQAHNPEHEEAEDQVEVQFDGEPIEIGFNVGYLLDALGAVETDTVEVCLTGPDSSCLIRAPGDTTVKYVVMPMRL
ncbi:MAG TPA: DNA polymerase III subunit beta [Steroidobacteraceae bacterium]|jgi:DNA polymerase-3 subunit beta|nr:DNA polymerase III subunit beta [Steroidobacteraceae bacterium]